MKEPYLSGKQTTTVTVRGKQGTITGGSDVPRAVTRWEELEYQDLVIPVTISILHWRHPDWEQQSIPDDETHAGAFCRHSNLF